MLCSALPKVSSGRDKGPPTPRWRASPFDTTEPSSLRVAHHAAGTERSHSHPIPDKMRRRVNNNHRGDCSRIHGEDQIPAGTLSLANTRRMAGGSGSGSQMMNGLTLCGDEIHVRYHNLD